MPKEKNRQSLKATLAKRIVGNAKNSFPKRL